MNTTMEPKRCVLPLAPLLNMLLRVDASPLGNWTTHHSATKLLGLMQNHALDGTLANRTETLGRVVTHTAHIRRTIDAL